LSVKKWNSLSTNLYNDKTYKWTNSGGPGGFAPLGEKLIPEWMSVVPDTLDTSIENVKKQQLVWGTTWKQPLLQALSMNPKPEQIMFLTDGVADKWQQQAKDIAELANKHNVRINTVALMEPKAREGMAFIAGKTGGQFVMVEANGSKRVQSTNSSLR